MTYPPPALNTLINRAGPLKNCLESFYLNLQFTPPEADPNDHPEGNHKISHRDTITLARTLHL